MSAVADAKERALNATRSRAAKGGNPPRFAYTHYFIEAEGLHSRIHLQNFFSTFWPQIGAPATAHVTVFAPDGVTVGKRDYEIVPFGSVFIELSELLHALGATLSEGMVAVDLEPPPEVRAEFHGLPDPASVQLNTPFWMAYYDDGGSYMYVHSIEMLRDQVIGANAALRWALGRGPSIREPWRSWRLIDAEDMTQMQLVVFNMGAEPGNSAVRVFDADTDRILFEREVTLQRHQLERVKIEHDEIATWRGSDGETPRHLRVGLEPLLTVNGKPYVLMRYGNGPLSVHHG